MSLFRGFLKVADTLELPKDVLLGLSKIIVYGNSTVIVENFLGLCGYDQSFLELKSNKGRIKIEGKNLIIKELSQDEINVSGEFYSITIIPLV